MSSAVLSTPAASGRLFVFDNEADPEMCSLAQGREPAGTQESPLVRLFQSTIKKQQSAIGNRKSAIENSVIPASRLEIRPAPERASSGVSAIDALTGGLPRGCLTEICGPASSGRTTVLLAALAAAARRGEFCVLVDASDALDPQSLAAAGVEPDRLLWVRCGESSPQRKLPPRRHPSTSLRAGSGTEKNVERDQIRSRNTKQTEQRLEQVLRATDLLLESGGFGLIVLDLADLPPQAARRIPLTTWFRFRRAVEHTPTILLSIEQQPIAGSCSSLLLQLGPAEQRFEGVEPAHAHLLTGLDINAEFIRSRVERKPACSVTFATKTAWAG